MSPEYTAACEAHNAAYTAFEDARDAYRSRRIGDAAFAAAQAVKLAADKAFDVAWHEELAREYAKPAATEPDEQLSLI